MSTQQLQPIAETESGFIRYTSYRVAGAGTDGADALIGFIDDEPSTRQDLVRESASIADLSVERPEDFALDMWDSIGVNGHVVLTDTVGEYIEIDGELFSFGAGVDIDVADLPAAFTAEV